MIKLIVTDLDGTLLNKDKKISEFTKQVLQRACDKGIKLCVATGRFITDIQNEMEEAGLKPYYICMNGAEVRDTDGKLIKNIDISYENCKKVLGIMKQNNCSPELYTDDGEYVIGLTEEESINEMIRRFKFLMPDRDFFVEDIIDTPRFKRRKIVKNFAEIIDKNLKVRKMLCFHDDIEKIKEIKAEINDIENLICVSALIHNFEVTHKLAQKGYALEELIKNIGINKDEVLVFGDGENDFNMFERFENTVAMGNSMKIILDSAKHITKTNQEDGVADFINKEIL